MRVRLGKVRRLLREAIDGSFDVVVSGPFRRGRGDYTAVVDFRWPTWGRGEVAWRKLSNALQRRKGGIQPLTPVERQHFTREGVDGTVLAILLDADNEREAVFQMRMVAADIEGLGFPVDIVGSSTTSLAPYR